MGLHSQAHQEAKQDRPFDLELGKQKHLCTVNSWRFNKERTKGMKPTISIFEDEIVITTDSFDLILKTGAPDKSGRQVGATSRGEAIDRVPFTDEGQVDWDNDPFAPSVHNLEQCIDEYKEQHPDQFPLGRTDKRVKYPEFTEKRVVNEATANAHIITTPNPSKLEGNGKHTRNLPAKPCKICGNDFKPTWNTQRYCPACKPKTGTAKRKPLAEQSAEELEKTLKEIENRRKKPYEFK